MPTTIGQLGINVFENNNLEKIADFTFRDKSEIHFLPFEFNKFLFDKFNSSFKSSLSS